MEKEKIDYFEEYELLGQRYPEIYQAVFEEGDLDSYEDKSQSYRNNPRLKGTSDLRNNRRSGNEERVRRSRSNRSSSRVKPRSNRNFTHDYDVRKSVNDMWENSSPSSSSQVYRKNRPQFNKQNKSKNFSSETSNYNHIDYVDYQPLEKSESEYKEENNNLKDIGNFDK